MAGDAKKMSYSLFRSMWAHSVMVALVFYLKRHLIEVLNLLENVLFKTWRRGNLSVLHCNCVENPFYEAGTTYKIWSIFMPPYQ